MDKQIAESLSRRSHKHDAASTPSLRTQKQRSIASMNPDIPTSPRPIESTVPIVGSSSIAPLGPFFPGSQPFAAFRPLDKDASHPLQNAPQAQNTMTLANNTHVPTDHELALLQSDGSSFHQPGYGMLGSDGTESTNFAGQLQGMKLIPNPPDLDHWREKIFNVDEMITMTEEQ